MNFGKVVGLYRAHRFYCHACAERKREQLQSLPPAVTAPQNREYNCVRQGEIADLALPLV